jgi:hypothetical protein
MPWSTAEKGGSNMGIFSKLLPKEGDCFDMSKYWKEIIRFTIYTSVMIIFDIVCGRFRSGSDNFD